MKVAFTPLNGCFLFHIEVLLYHLLLSPYQKDLRVQNETVSWLLPVR